MAFIPIIGFEGLYSINEEGLVYSHRSGSFIQWNAKPHGKKPYYKVDLWKGGERKKFFIHRLVAIHFLGFDPKSGLEVNHISGNKKDCSINNLEIITREENIQHGLQFRKKKGEQ